MSVCINKILRGARARDQQSCVVLIACSSLLSSLELSDTQVYTPETRALLGTALPSCAVVMPGHVISSAGLTRRRDPLARMLSGYFDG